MNKTTLTLVIAILLFSNLLPQTGAAQEKQDTVVMTSGEKKIGKVTGISDEQIRFVHSGETLEYELKKEKIGSIHFASGRIEVINATGDSHPDAQAPAQAPSSTPEQRKNKIAVLPFEIFTNDPSLGSESMSKQVQLSCVDALRDQSPFQTIQDPMVTNTILAKHNMSASSLSVNTPKEWAELLGVEYVIIGSYSIENKGTFTSGTGYTSYDKDKKDDGKGSSFSSGNAYSTKSYATKVAISIYNDQGNSIFSDTRRPAFGTVDSYNPGLKTLIKRTPFAKK